MAYSESWPFLFRVLVDPIRALDLLDSKNNTPDHTKVIPFIMLVAALVFKALGMPFSTLELTILFTASFGLSAWKMFLRARTVTGTITQNYTTTRNIIERRDPELGVDPTYE